MWEQGRIKPDFETLDFIANFFNNYINFLFGKTYKTTYMPNPNKYKNERYVKNETEKNYLFFAEKQTMFLHKIAGISLIFLRTQLIYN